MTMDDGRAKKKKRVVETTSAAESKQGIPLLAEVIVSS